MDEAFLTLGRTILGILAMCGFLVVMFGLMALLGRARK